MRLRGDKKRGSKGGEVAMASFGAKDIKKLREITSAGMMDCKKL